MTKLDKTLGVRAASSFDKHDRVTKQNFGANYPLIASIASGKGGVGKTLTVVNFAVAACQMGHKVLILDGDLGLANVDVVLGLQAKYNIKDVFDGRVPLSDIILDGPHGMKIIPSGSGITSLHTLTYTQRQILAEELASLGDSFDVLLIDSGAGIGPNVLDLCALAHRRVVIATPEPHSLTDAYALIKVCTDERNIGRFDLIVNMAASAREAHAVAHKLRSVAEQFLGVDVSFLGYVPTDAQIGQAVLRRAAASTPAGQTLAGQAWRQLARTFFAEERYKQQRISHTDFWSHFLRPERSHLLNLASS